MKLRRWSSLAFLGGLALSGAVEAGPRYIAYDVALHLQQCAKRPAFFVLWTADRLAGEALPPCKTDSLPQWLAARNLRGVFEKDVILVVDANPDLQPSAAEAWNRLQLEVSVRSPSADERRSAADSPGSYKYIPTRRDLSAEELRKIGAWIARNIPMPPVHVPSFCSTCGSPPQTAVLKLEIVLEAVKLRDDGPEELIGWLGGNLTSRIVVLEVQGRAFHLKWLSPLLEPYRQVLIYRDVNADGQAEIWSLSAEAGASQEVWKLSIFDSAGQELTRDAGECEWAVGVKGDSAPPLPSACPIIGFPSIDHTLDDQGKVIIEAVRELHGNSEPARTYHFVNGKYISRKRSQAPPPG